MAKAFGIINTTGNHIWVEGMQDYRPIGAFSFLGRYRIVDFPMSNFSNSGIDRIHVIAGSKPRSLTEHIGSGRHYNINSKRGNVQLLFAENQSRNSIYNTDIAVLDDNLADSVAKMNEPYVIVVPSHMVFKQDYKALLDAHVASGADITLLYHSTEEATSRFLNCDYVELNRQKGVLAIAKNRGNEAQRDIFLDTYVMKTDLFVELIKKAKALSSMYTLAQIVNLSCAELDVRGYAHEGYFAAITDLKSYYDANLALLDMDEAEALINESWPIYTRTNDSAPTQYFPTANVKQSAVSNGCLIKGSIENSIIGRGCTIEEGAVIKNSVVLPDTYIAADTVVSCQVVDKHSKLLHCKELIATVEEPGYVKRSDTLKFIAKKTSLMRGSFFTIF